MCKLDLEKSEKPEIKLPASVGSQKKQGNSKNTSTLVSMIMLKPLTMWITRNQNILKEMGIPDHLNRLLRNLYAGQAATELDLEQLTGSKLGKEHINAVYCHPAYLTYMQNIPYKNARLDDSQAGIKTVRKNINLGYADDGTLMTEIEEELKDFLMRVRVKKLV